MPIQPILNVTVLKSHGGEGLVRQAYGDAIAIGCDVLDAAGVEAAAARSGTEKRKEIA